MLEAKNQTPEPEKSIPGYLKISGAVFLVAAIYLGYIFWARAQQRAAFEQHEAERKAQQAAADQKAVEGMGGSEFKILNFYADPPVISRGDSTELCYGVSNAQSVTLQPQTNAVWPAFSKCVSVSPRKTTEYTFTATNAAGQAQSSKLTVEVR
jgi:cytoskeletal protein RodZ